jgi:hypothetical protein
MGRILVIFRVLTVMTMKADILWDAAPFSLCRLTDVSLNVVDEFSTLLLRIRDVPCLNLGPETGYPDGGFLVIFLSPFGRLSG